MGDWTKGPIVIVPWSRQVGSTNPGAGLAGFNMINERAHLPCALVLQRRDVDGKWLGGCMADGFDHGMTVGRQPGRASAERGRAWQRPWTRKWAFLAGC